MSLAGSCLSCAPIGSSDLVLRPAGRVRSPATHRAAPPSGFTSRSSLSHRVHKYTEAKLLTRCLVSCARLCKCSLSLTSPIRIKPWKNSPRVRRVWLFLKHITQWVWLTVARASETLGVSVNGLHRVLREVPLTEPSCRLASTFTSWRYKRPSHHGIRSHSVLEVNKGHEGYKIESPYRLGERKYIILLFVNYISKNFFCLSLNQNPIILGSVVVRLLASHLGVVGSIPSGVTSGFSPVVIVSGDAASRQVSSGISRFSRSCIPALLLNHLTLPPLAIKASMLKAVQISPLYTKMVECVTRGPTQSFSELHTRNIAGPGTDHTHPLFPATLESGPSLCEKHTHGGRDPNTPRESSRIVMSSRVLCTPAISFSTTHRRPGLDKCLLARGDDTLVARVIVARITVPRTRKKNLGAMYLLLRGCYSKEFFNASRLRPAVEKYFDGDGERHAQASRRNPHYLMARASFLRRCDDKRKWNWLGRRGNRIRDQVIDRHECGSGEVDNLACIAMCLCAAGNLRARRYLRSFDSPACQSHPSLYRCSQSADFTPATAPTLRTRLQTPDCLLGGPPRLYRQVTRSRRFLAPQSVLRKATAIIRTFLLR
ncbi:hypothetical protein PR048_018044 [Dryococelus australis]|uniref:Uncharacterized protein n=1 Tax=Dryococelus australis TaxID=614101 RepID=A0ABQ9HBB8_9NEOP|nr:hypothetical protein PR048_018044 [Dryococelus australis]